LVIVGGLDSVVNATRELKSVSRVDVCVETAKNALREAGLGSAEKVSMLALSVMNVKERLEFVKMHRDWTVRN
jgi:hypothetical protein